MYKLILSEEDIKAINFVGPRYAWSDSLKNMTIGINEIIEPEAWYIVTGFEEDTDGNHSPFPMLDPYSDLYRKLFAFWNEVL